MKNSMEEFIIEQANRIHELERQAKRILVTQGQHGYIGIFDDHYHEWNWKGTDLTINSGHQSRRIARFTRRDIEWVRIQEPGRLFSSSRLLIKKNYLVVCRGEEWKEQPGRVRVHYHQGDWEKALSQLYESYK